MKIIKLILCLFSLGAIHTKAQTDVTPYQPGITAEGVTYYLPRTAFTVKVVAKETTYTPGDFCQYAERYLHLNNISCQKSTEWQIEQISINPIGIPDSSKIFSVKIKDKTVAPLVQLNEDGILLAINTEAPNSTPVTKEILETSSSNKLNSRNYMTEDILSATSTAKMAQLTAEEIYEIRDSRNALTRGQADNLPKDGAQLKLMLERLETQDEALTQLFKGYETVTTKEYTFTIDPKAEVEKEILFRFSRKLGVIDNDDLGGAPVYFQLTDRKTAPVQQETNDKKKKIENGIRYNVPSRAQLKITYGNQVLCQGDFPVGQFGHVEILSNTLFNKKNTTTVTFYETNGGIMKIDAE